MLVIFIIKPTMTQEDKDRFDELLEIVKRQREELKPMLKTAIDRAVFQKERGEAEIWEALKSKWSPENYSEMEEILRNNYNGDVEKFAEDWLIISQQVDEE